MFRVVREASIFVARRNSTCHQMMAGHGRKLTVNTFKVIRKARHLQNQRTHSQDHLEDKRPSLTLESTTNLNHAVHLNIKSKHITL